MAFLCICACQLVVATITDVSDKPPDFELSRDFGFECWEVDNAFERDCFHQEPLTMDPYPLTPEMFKRSVPYATSDYSLHRAFRRARERGVLKIVVLGGSVTFGHQCSSPAGLEGKSCAWPHRMEQWFRQACTDFDVEVQNASLPGSSIMQFLHHGMDRVLPENLEVDLIIVDFGVNDAVIELFDFNVEYVKMAHDTLIRYVFDAMLHSPALLYAESFIAPHRVAQAPWQSEDMAKTHAAVTQAYGIPMASFRHAVWPDINNSYLANLVWGEEVHPGWQAHQLMADVVVYYMQQSYARFAKVHGTLSDPSPREIQHQRFQDGLGCLGYPRSSTVPLFSYLGRPPPRELVSATGWSVAQNAGRPGLTGFGNSSNTAIATFDIPCSGERQVLDVEYLVSYEGMGAARVIVDARPGAEYSNGGGANSIASEVIVDGLWGSQASVSWYETIPLPDTGNTASDATVRVTFKTVSAEEETQPDISSHLFDADGDVRGDRKFKLFSLQCC
ncbi:unnamed protein product [Ectocarpus sp. 12 AP-2014]